MGSNFEDFEMTRKGNLRILAEEIEERMKGASEEVQGTSIRIISDWRDQPIGSSKPNLKGRTFPVKKIWYGGRNRWFIFAGDLRCGIELEKVEFVDELPSAPATT